MGGGSVSRALLSEAAALALDAGIFSTNAADASRPAGILAGVAGLTPTAGGSISAEAAAKDIGQLPPPWLGDHLLAQMTPSTSTTNTTPVTVA